HPPAAQPADNRRPVIAIVPPAPAIDLGGAWEFRADPKGIGEHYAGQLAYTHWDDARWMRADTPAGWAAATVPGPWPIARDGHATPVWFRRRFPRPDGGPRWRLGLDGVSYRADAWLNGRYLGTHEGYFAPFGFDVTDALADDNLLVIRVVPPA